VASSEKRFQRELADAEVLFREGDPAGCMFVVRTGKMRVTKRVRGREQTLAVLGPGEFFGEMALLNNEPRSATLVAQGNAVLVEVDAKRFEGMLSTSPEIALRIIKNLAKRLEVADEMIAILTQRDAKARVILGLIREAQEHGVALGEEGHRMLVPCDLDELSSALGLQRSETDDVLGRLRRIGLVKQTPEGTEIQSLAKLGEFLEFLERRDA